MAVAVENGGEGAGMEIKTGIKIGDPVFWVKDRYTKSGKKRFMIYPATVKSIRLCEYQGALYCELDSPAFKLNPNPVVHYSFVFPTKEEAAEFRSAVRGSTSYRKCWGCEYAWKGAKEGADA